MNSIKVTTYEIILSLAKAVDLVSPRLADHHLKVALIASNICNELQLTAKESSVIVFAAALHDIGAFSLQERISFLNFEIKNPHEHAFVGYNLLKSYEPFSEAANIIRFHHVPWADGEGSWFGDQKVPIGSHILHLADRIAILLGKQRRVLLESTTISKIIVDNRGRLFVPDLVDAFRRLEKKESFWLEISSPPEVYYPIFPAIETSHSELLELAKLFSRIIDFRSRFTVTHSSGVSACASRLAGLMGFSEEECYLMEVAGYLHDLGKLVIPIKILEKPSSGNDNRKLTICDNRKLTTPEYG